MILRPGSFAWLVMHDLRLSWRRLATLFRRIPMQWTVVIAASVTVGLHLLAWPLAGWLLESTAQGNGRYVLASAGFVFVFPWLVSQAITGATRALYSRGDLDLLLASPLPARRVFAAHATATALDSLSSVAILLVPLVNAAAWMGGLHWLAVYPALVAAAFLATALGLALTVALFGLIGPRRTRLVAQIVATVIGAAFVISLQAINVVPASWRDAFSRSLGSEAGGVLGLDSPLLLPARALAGDAWPLAIWMGLSALAFAGVAVGLGAYFCDAVVRASGAQMTQVRRGAQAADRAFAAGLGRVVRQKELRQLARDSWLVSQLLLQVVYTLPVAIIVWRSQGTEGAIAISVAPAIVVITSQIAASLAWLAISSEDAPDLLATAPVTRGQIERRKVEAIVWPLAIFLVGPLLGLAVVSIGTALLTAVFSIAAATSATILNVWNPMPGRRAQMMRRHAQSKLVGLVEHFMSLCWAMALVLSVLGSLTAIAPVAAVIGVLAVMRHRSQTRAASTPFARQASASGAAV